MDKDITESIMEKIKESYGYGMPGTHPKKCEICGGVFEEPNDLDVLIVKGPFRCPDCGEIIRLKQVLIDHWNELTSKQSNDPIENRNLIKNPTEIKTRYGTTTSYTLDDYEKSFEIEGRTRYVREKIELIDEARNLLYLPLDAQLKILESIYERKDRFWGDGGNLAGYVRDASFQVLVIKLREFLGGNSKYSYTKIKNELQNRRKALYDDHKIVEVRKFKRSGEVMKTEYPHFPIEDYLGKLNDVIEAYKKKTDALIDYRNGVFVHTSGLKNPESEHYMTFRNVKQILNSLKIIYDGFLYSIAPDLYKNLWVKHSMEFDHMNEISQYWADWHK